MLQIRHTRAWQQLVNPHNLDLIRGNCIRTVEQPELVVTIKGKLRENINRRCIQTQKAEHKVRSMFTVITRTKRKPNIHELFHVRFKVEHYIKLN
jgi:hypothetical protein